MKYPTLTPLATTREMLDVFKGYHHNLRIGEGEFYEMENLSSDHYPILSPRGQRGVAATPGIAQGMIAKTELCYIDGSDFVMGDVRVPMGLTADEKPKTLVSMGAYVIVMPDKKYVNTSDTSDFGRIEAFFETSAEVTFTLCSREGADYGDAPMQSYAPSEPEDLALWIDSSQKPCLLRRYYLSTNNWIALDEAFVKISSPGIGALFRVGDGVRVSGVKDERLADLNATSVVWARSESYVVVSGATVTAVKQSEPVTVERNMPDMDFVIESENRLFGCRYGDGVNAIYACRTGDFRNWSCESGALTDTYFETVGTDGAFTGAITHLGYPLFFKENCVHKIYGSAPSNFRIQTTALRGVQEGCNRSLATVGETLYYKSRTGVCAYDGSLPLEISSALGEEAYGNAVGGSLGNKYYVSMSDASGDYHLFVYDTQRKMWHREDGTRASDFCAFGGELYYVDYATHRIMTVRGTGVREEEPIRWSAVTGVIGTDSPDKKYISRMDVRLKLDVGARVAFFAEYDSSGEFEYLFAMTGKSLQSFSIPIRPKRCDHLRLRIVGNGEAKIFSICKTVEKGSDL